MSPSSRERCAALVFVVAAALGAACGKDPEPAPEQVPAAPAEVQAPVVAPTPSPEPKPEPQAAVDDTPLPVIEDFEAEVEQSITADNYKTELAALEADTTP